MGEVYRARDSKLARDVAIKILRAGAVADVDQLRRFEREARLLAALNHPNIAQIYGLERQEFTGEPKNPAGVFIVMELVEGQTLAQALASTDDGRIPVIDAMAIARQIAKALGAAHARGIVHRDIKPANIKITPAGEVKVLDFGIAKETPSSADVDSEATTGQYDGTRDGVVLGTASYMSPEQARGQAVDRRSDIWAFGCVLYEMLAGRRAFPGVTTADRIAAVLSREPDWGALPPEASPTLTRLLHGCLEKDPSRRLSELPDAGLDGNELTALTLAGGGEPAPRMLRRAAGPHFLPVIAALVFLSVAIALWASRGPSSRTLGAAAPTLLDVRPASALLGSHPLERATFGRMRPSRRAIALSPDGRTLAFTAYRDGAVQMYLRLLDRKEATAVPGTENADGPFFSPDGEWIGFWAAGALRKVPRAGGAVVKLCDASITYGADWAASGEIFFAQGGTIWRVPEVGGEPVQVTRPVPGQGDARHVLPHAAPGGKWLLFTSLSAVNDWARARVEAQSLSTGERKVLLNGAMDARYAPTGHLLFMRLGNLDAAPFDIDLAQLTGGEVTLVRDVMHSVNSSIPITLDTGSGQYTFSASGALAYVTGGIHQDVQSVLQWVGRDGKVEVIDVPAPPRPFFLPRLSPDGKALVIGTQGLRENDLWRYEFGDRSLTRLTTEGRAENALWSPDGTRLAFMSTRDGGFHAYLMRSDGGGALERLTSGGTEYPGAWTPDGRSLVIQDGGDVSLISAQAAAAPQKLVATRFRERIPDLSPDGRWLAYVSDESGDSEVYVRSFPDLGNKRRISAGGGSEPAWSRNGRKLLFLSPRKTRHGDRVAMVEIDVAKSGGLATSAPKTLFELDALNYPGAVSARSYDLTPDASRFLFIHETYKADAKKPDTIHFVARWFDELRGLQSR